MSHHSGGSGGPLLRLATVSLGLPSAAVAAGFRAGTKDGTCGRDFPKTQVRLVSLLAICEILKPSAIGAVFGYTYFCFWKYGTLDWPIFAPERVPLSSSQTPSRYMRASTLVAASAEGGSEKPARIKVPLLRSFQSPPFHR